MFVTPLSLSFLLAYNFGNRNSFSGEKEVGERKGRWGRKDEREIWESRKDTSSHFLKPGVLLLPGIIFKIQMFPESSAFQSTVWIHLGFNPRLKSSSHAELTSIQEWIHVSEREGEESVNLNDPVGKFRLRGMIIVRSEPRSGWKIQARWEGGKREKLFF